MLNLGKILNNLSFSHICRNVRIYHTKFLLFLMKVLLVFSFVNFQLGDNRAHADAASSAMGVVDWIAESLVSLVTIFSNACNKLPELNNFQTGSVQFSLDHTDGDLGVFKEAGIDVEQGKMVKVQWTSTGIQARPRKYIVIYRIDPRFSRPQIFILRKNYATGNYDSEFEDFDSGSLANYQSDPKLDFADRLTKFDQFFSLQENRPLIEVDYGDVVNISLGDMVDVQSANSSFSNLLTSANESDIASIHMITGLAENRILYSGTDSFCNYVAANPGLMKNYTCTTNPSTGATAILSAQSSYRKLYGALDVVAPLTIMPCPANVSGPSASTLCSYDRGRGMNITLGGTEIKTTYAPFFHSDIADKDFFYYKSSSRGVLNFNTTIPMDNIYANFPDLMVDWANNPNHNPNFADTVSYVTSLHGYTDTAMNYMHLGRYVMLIDIGNSESPANFHQQNDIKVTYKVGPPAPAPEPNSGGITLSTQEHQSNASQAGTLWIKVDSPHNEVTGNIRVSYAYYTGSTFLSNLLYDNIALPVMELMRSTAAIFYQGIATNPTWQLTVRTLLILYISIYSIYFLIGKVQITAMDILIRFTKLAVVFAMFDSNSWQFFNDRVFTLFLDGMSYLVVSITGVNSSVGNVFGFVDIIFDKYTNPTIWKILAVNLLQFYNGMTYLAILMIEAILGYLLAVIDVVIAYVMAFLTMTVLISLAPLFIVAMLFERTRTMFDNWMSLLFNYMIQPTVFLAFFLLMDQIITNQFSQTALKVCWGMLINFTFDLDLGLIGIPIRIRFDLPFLPGFPFFIPLLGELGMGVPFEDGDTVLTKIAGAVLMFKIYAQISQGLIEYVTDLTAEITNVAPARKSGDRQSATNPTKAIADQLKTPITAPARAISKGTKDMAKAAYRGWKNPTEGKSGEGRADFSKDRDNMDAKDGTSMDQDGKDGSSELKKGSRNDTIINDEDDKK